MRGTTSADVRVETFATFATLPPDAAALQDRSLFARRDWWDVVLSDAMAPGVTPAFVLCRSAGQAVALAPMLRTAGGSLQSLTTPYTCRYAPLFAAVSVNTLVA